MRGPLACIVSHLAGAYLFAGHVWKLFATERRHGEECGVWVAKEEAEEAQQDVGEQVAALAEDAADNLDNINVDMYFHSEVDIETFCKMCVLGKLRSKL